MSRRRYSLSSDSPFFGLKTYVSGSCADVLEHRAVGVVGAGAEVALEAVLDVRRRAHAAVRRRAVVELHATQLERHLQAESAAIGIGANKHHGVRADRSGRGRAGSEGQAVSLVCVDEHGLLKGIERLIKRDLEKRIEPGFEPDPNAKP